MNLNSHTHYNPESILLGVYPVEISAHVYKKTSIRTFIQVLFIVVKKYLSINERKIRKLWNIHMMKHYVCWKRTSSSLVIKNNVQWKKLDTEEYTLYSAFMWSSEEAKLTQSDNGQNSGNLCGEQSGREIRELSEELIMFCNSIPIIISQANTCVNIYWVIHLGFVSFPVCN